MNLEKGKIGSEIEIRKDILSKLAKSLKKIVGPDWGKEVAKRIAEKEKKYRDVNSTKVYNVINGRIKNPVFVATIIIHASALIEENKKKIAEAFSLIKNK